MCPCEDLTPFFIFIFFAIVYVKSYLTTLAIIFSSKKQKNALGSDLGIGMKNTGANFEGLSLKKSGVIIWAFVGKNEYITFFPSNDLVVV